MLEFILGGAGSGKTYLISERIKEDIAGGKSPLLLVPEQETVARERAMTLLLPPSAQLCFEVSNFTRLANSFSRVHGGLTYKYVDSSVKSLAVWNTVRTLSPLLSEYGKQKKDAGFGSMVLSQLEEFKAGGVTPAALERAAEHAEPGSGLEGKLKDLALIYSAYTAALEEYGAGDPSDDIGKMAGALPGKRYFEGKSIYIDSFTSFTGTEEAVIFHMLSEADSITVALPMDIDGNGLQFISIKETQRRLCRLAEKCGCPVTETRLSENRRTADPALLRLSKDIWRFDAETGASENENSGSIELIKCTNIYDEAEAVAATVSRLVIEGMRYRDICIIARKAESYEGIIDNALEKAGIPFFMSRREDITSMPAAALLLCALKIKNNGLRTEDVISYIKTGLVGSDSRSMDLFEQYIWRWSIKGNAFFGDSFTMDPYSYSSECSEMGRATLDAVNLARAEVMTPLAVLFDKIDSAKTNRDICKAMFEFTEDIRLADKLRSFASVCRSRGEITEAENSLRLYNSILDALSVIAEFDCGEDRYDCEEFEMALRIVLSETSLGNIPTSCDEVTVGSASLFRADNPGCVIMMGLCDGVFPASAEEGRMLGDAEREFLFSQGIELSGNRDEKAAEELFYVYRAISAPSEKLVMTYGSSELSGGKEIFPSLAFERARILSGIAVTDYATLGFEDRLWDSETAFEYMNLSGDEVKGALNEYFSENEKYKDKLSALYIPITDRDCVIPSELACAVFGDRMSFSPSALEKYVKCHFDYWCEYVLHLRAEEKNIFRLNDTGSLIHALLEKFISLVTDENGFNAEKAENEGEELIDELMRLYVEENFPEKDVSRAQTAHVISKLRSLTHVLARNITKELKKSRFTPAFFELKINEQGEDAARPVSFTLSDGSVASVRGIADRVDAFRDGDDIYIKVVDYKTGSKEFKLDDIKKGLNMQMLLYLFSICSVQENKRLFGNKNGRLLPCGVVYLSSKISSLSEKSDVSDREIEERAEEKLTRSGILISDENVLRAINSELDFSYIMSGAKTEKKRREKLTDLEGMRMLEAEMTSSAVKQFEELRAGKASISPLEDGGRLPCEYCKMRSVCRDIERTENQDEEDEE